MVTEDDVRQVALSLTETAEKPYNRLSGFRMRSNARSTAPTTPATTSRAA